jgi:hypothetical protein
MEAEAIARTELQVLFAQHLLAWVRRLPPGRVLAMTAGELLRRLESLPYSEPPITPPADDPPPIYARLGRNLPKGEPRRRVAEKKRADSSGTPSIATCGV